MLAAAPIIVIVVITAIKDAIEDSRRTVLDMEVNNTATEILGNWHNYNVTEEDVSLWRRIKKATSHFILRVSRNIKNRKQRKAAAKDAEKGLPTYGHELTRAVTVQSVYSHRDSMAYDEDDDGLENPFEGPNAQAEGSTVIDRTRTTPGKARFKRDYWKNVRVGDFVRIRNDEEIPADLVVLATSDTDGACYIETKNLDGETNLKVRQALKCGEGIRHSKDCERARFWIESEGPLPNLYSYNAVAKWRPHDDDPEDVRSEPISINNLLLRGCSLRNTKWAIGVVVFTGEDTKIMKNAGITPTKRSRISRELNFSVITNFVLLAILCFVSGLINGIQFNAEDTSITYFEYGMIGGSPPVNGIVTFWASLILYQSLVPISLYISVEIVKTIQAFFIYSDSYMYYEPIDYPCTPKSWNISDDLGQIEYVFSDKTGTLTQNVMQFKKCTVDGVAYGKAYTEALAGLRKREGIDVEAEGKAMQQEIAADKREMLRKLRSINDSEGVVDDDVTFVSSQFVDDLLGSSGRQQQQANNHFMLALALCHSVIAEPDKSNPGRTVFKAQSPDEAALVATARDMGFAFEERTQRGAIINIQGRREEFQILNTLEFNSTRKRMSAIVKFKNADPTTGSPRERIVLICKGADSVIYSRLRPNEQSKLRQETALHLEQFANEGLRTLCLAERELTAEQYADWNSRHEVAAAALVNREEKMEEVADSIERDMMLIGGTAIEDRLQEGVPQTISLLGAAGIKLWVLTGDKVETAINIGFSCNLLDNAMELLVLRVEDETVEAADKLISDYLHRYFGMTGSEEELAAAKLDHSPPSDKYAVIIDGSALKLALDSDLQRKFLLLCKQCKSVLCCRVSPAQKAAVVRLVKTSLDVMTLSIGDGANDVAMIQEADVGVGIAGEEGRQAVMSSDYAIGQFKFLARLLLVHGRWSYKRLAEMIPNFFYKNVVFTLALFWYGIFSSFDCTYLFEYSYVTFFNLAFTSLPVIIMGILDQDVDARVSLAVPQLYRTGILRQEWTQKKFWIYMIDGVYQSAISFFFPYFCFWLGKFENATGLPINHRFWIGLAVCSIAVFSCNLFVLLNQYRWDWFSLLINAISMLLVYFWSGVYSSSTYSGELYKAASEMFGSLIYWVVLLVGVAVCLIPHLSQMALQSTLKPRDIDIIREQVSMGNFDYILADEENNSDLGLMASIVSGHRTLQDGSGQSSAGGKKFAASETDSFETATEHGTPPSKAVTSPRMSPQKKRFSFRRSEPGSEPYDGTRSTDLATPTSPDFVRFGDRRVRSEEHHFSDHGDEDTAGFEFEHRRRDHDYDRTMGYYQRQSFEQQTGRNLDNIRNSLRMEQMPSRQSMEGMRTSMEISDLTTAGGLMKVMSNNSTR